MSSSRTSHSATSSLSSTEARPRLVTVPSEASIDLTSPRVPSPVDASLQTADHNHPANRLMHMSSGVPSTRVGLGSPQLDFRPEWTWRENGEARHSASAEKTGKPNGLVNRISGLPSPPGTESDVALPRANNAEQHSSRPPASIERHSSTRLVPRRTSTSSARPAPARTLSMSSSTSQKLPSSGSSISSSNRKSIRPRRSPGMSRSSSSSSQLAFMTAPSTARGMSTEDPHPHTAVHGSQLLNNVSAPNSVSSRRSGSAAVSPAQASSSVLPEGRMSNRLSSSWENGLDAQEIAEEPRRASGGGLDARIRDAEEKIRSSSVRRLTSEGDDSRGTIRGYTSYARGSPVKASPTAIDSSTIRRSATVSEYSGRPRHADTPLRDRFAEYEERGTPESMRANVQQRSGGSAESGRRKPLPSEFMSGAAFTPSPEASFSPRSMRLQGLAYSKHQESPLASRYHTTSRLSREIDGVPSPSRSRMYPSPSKIDGLKRSSAALQRLPAGTDGRGNPSPYRADMLERHRRPASVLDTSYDRQHYLSRTPAESDRATPSRMRNGLAPSDSVSAVGGRTFEPREEGKNPLDVIRRIEQSRAEHNKQWQADRAQSVIGDREPTGFSRPPSRYEQHFTPHRIRPATSMSTIHHDGPRTAPVERYRRAFDENTNDAIPHRASSRLSYVGGSSSEPRPMRNATSLGGRYSAPLIDVHKASTEHGRLLFEACQALAVKLGSDPSSALPELVHLFSSTAQSSEAANVSLHTAVHLSTALSTAIELGDPKSFRENAMRLATALRDASRQSDQEIRDLTRIMLDLPKLFRKDSVSLSRPTTSAASSSVRGNGSGVSGVSGGIGVRPMSVDLDPTKSALAADFPRRWRAGAGSPESRFTSTPSRRSEEIFRSSTANGNAYSYSHSPTAHLGRQRESLPPNLHLPTADRERSSMASFVAKVRNLGSSATPRRPADEGLQTIEASPPAQYDPQQPAPRATPSLPFSATSSDAPPAGAGAGTGVGGGGGVGGGVEAGMGAVPPSPYRPNVLKKKISTASTNTVRGSSFFPSNPKVRTTTAISQVTAGGSGGGEDALSARSARSSMDWNGDGVEPHSPASRFSFHTAEAMSEILSGTDNGNGNGSGSGSGSGSGNGNHSGSGDGIGNGSAHGNAREMEGKGRRSGESGGGGGGGGEGEDAVRALAMAAKLREAREDADARKGSISERFRGVLRRG